jgi:hypothetical protein
MIAYNVTVKVSWDIVEPWLVWMQQVHIPAVLGTGQFDRHTFFQLLEQDETEGPTFVVQYITSSMERYEQYVLQFAPALQADGRNKWGDGFIAFRTVMQSL